MERHLHAECHAGGNVRGRRVCRGVLLVSFLSSSDSARVLTSSDTYSHVNRKPLNAAEDIAALPFTLSDSERLLSNTEPDGDLNRFRVRAGQSLAEWEKAGWIWAEDPRGWAQWYTRFWDGRRCEDDERQVRRCKWFCGWRRELMVRVKGRWANRTIQESTAEEGQSVRRRAGLG